MDEILHHASKQYARSNFRIEFACKLLYIRLHQGLSEIKTHDDEISGQSMKTTIILVQSYFPSIVIYCSNMMMQFIIHQCNKGKEPRIDNC